MTCDPVKLTAELIQCASVTPKDDGAVGVVKMALEEAGFACTEIERGGVKNLFARWGEKGSTRTLGFNGHVDVVPIGNEADWTYGPFSAEIAEGKMWGRGAVDMKSGVAAFVAAAVDIVTNAPPSGSIVITVTGDEEGPATDGTTAILDWMAENSENISACLVGEPTCPNEMGEMMKIGRRGSMTAYFVAHGVQGHSAYPHRAKHPVTAIAQLGAQLTENPMDNGTDHFEPSTLALTTIDVGNAANNVIPASATMTVNIRFNDAHTSTSVEDWLRTEAKEVEDRLDLKIDVTSKCRVKASSRHQGNFQTWFRVPLKM